MSAQQIADHARRDMLQSCVILVSLRYGDQAGEWLLAELQRLGAFGEAEASGNRASNREVHSRD